MTVQSGDCVRIEVAEVDSEEVDTTDTVRKTCTGLRMTTEAVEADDGIIDMNQHGISLEYGRHKAWQFSFLSPLGLLLELVCLV